MLVPTRRNGVTDPACHTAKIEGGRSDRLSTLHQCSQCDSQVSRSVDRAREKNGPGPWKPIHGIADAAWGQPQNALLPRPIAVRFGIVTRVESSEQRWSRDLALGVALQVKSTRPSYAPPETIASSRTAAQVRPVAPTLTRGANDVRIAERIERPHPGLPPANRLPNETIQGDAGAAWTLRSSSLRSQPVFRISSTRS